MIIDIEILTGFEDFAATDWLPGDPVEAEGQERIPH